MQNHSKPRRSIKVEAGRPQAVIIAVHTSGIMIECSDRVFKEILGVLITLQAGSQGPSSSRYRISLAVFDETIQSLYLDVDPRSISLQEFEGQFNSSFSKSSGRSERQFAHGRAEVLGWVMERLEDTTEALLPTIRKHSFLNYPVPPPCIVIFGDGRSMEAESEEKRRQLREWRLCGLPARVACRWFGSEPGALRSIASGIGATMDEQQFIDNLLGTGEFIAEVRGSLLITDEECYRPQMAGVSLVSYPLLDDNATLAFGDDQSDMDLSATHCRIHATLRRNEDKSMDAELHPGCVVNVKRSQGQWKAYAGGVRIPLEPGMVLFDPAGARSMQVIARQVHPEWRRELEGRVESGDS